MCQQLRTEMSDLSVRDSKWQKRKASLYLTQREILSTKQDSSSCFLTQTMRPLVSRCPPQRAGSSSDRQAFTCGATSPSFVPTLLPFGTTRGTLFYQQEKSYKSGRNDPKTIQEAPDLSGYHSLCGFLASKSSERCQKKITPGDIHLTPPRGGGLGVRFQSRERLSV